MFFFSKNKNDKKKRQKSKLLTKICFSSKFCLNIVTFYLKTRRERNLSLTKLGFGMISEKYQFERKNWLIWWNTLHR